MLPASCSLERLLVVSDPYVEAAYGGRWAPAGPVFAARAGISGYRVVVETAESPSDLRAIVEGSGTAPGLVLVSPLNADAIGNMPPGGTRFIVAGGSAAAVRGNAPVSAVVPERSAAMGEAGGLAGRLASESGKPAVLLLGSVRERDSEEIRSLVEAFSAETEEGLLIHAVGGESKEIPVGFAADAAAASVLLLFAGPGNIEAMEATDEAGIQVITEDLRGSGAWSERIAASIEDDPKAQIDALMAMIRGKSDSDVLEYPAKMVE